MLLFCLNDFLFIVGEIKTIKKSKNQGLKEEEKNQHYKTGSHHKTIVTIV